MRKRHRRRRSLQWAPILWVLWVAEMCVGLAFSPVTSVSHVRVEGARDFDRDRIVRDLQDLRDVPCLRADAYAIESRFLLLPEARSAELSRNVFRRAAFSVSYHEPVARVVGYPSVALSREGILYHAERLSGALPRIRIPASASAPHLALCLGWDGRSLSYVCLKLRTIEQLENPVVEVDSRGALCLNSGIGPRINLGPSGGSGSPSGKATPSRMGWSIVLGPPERLDEKLDKLAAILRERPGILQQVTELNLISPAQAVMVRRTQGAKP